MIFGWKGIIIHHSLTRDSGTMSWDAIRRFHTETRGWRDIGYHAGCERIRDSYEILIGRPIDYSGGHTKGLNNDHLGLCFVGNYDLVEPDPEMLVKAAKYILRPWMKAFDIPLDRIEGHSDYAPKTCPGSKFSVEKLKDIIRDLPKADK